MSKSIKELSRELMLARNDSKLHEEKLNYYINDFRIGVKKIIEREKKYLKRKEEQLFRANELLKEEKRLIKEGYLIVAGVDEAGRGPLAGPVVAASVMLPLDFEYNHLINDSKKINESTREFLYEEIIAKAIDVRVAFVTPAVIDKINILQASLLAMAMAVKKLDPEPQIVLVDGNKKIPALNLTQRAIIKGDAKVRVISAASIIAKVYRDKLMKRLSNRFQLYNFDINKGYPTTDHRRALREHGHTAIHRETFKMKSNE